MDKKDTSWFKHDYEPTSDPKIQAMLSEYGGIGYGVYWRVVEMLHSDSLHKLPLKKYLFLAIANQMLPNAKQKKANLSTFILLPEEIEIFIKDCINTYELFGSDGDFFWAERVLRNIDNKNNLSVKRSESGRRGGIAKYAAKQNQANAKQNQANAKQILAEEKRLEEIREDEIRRELDPEGLETLLTAAAAKKNGSLKKLVGELAAKKAAAAGIEDWDEISETEVSNLCDKILINKPTKILFYVNEWIVRLKNPKKNGSAKNKQVGDDLDSRNRISLGSSVR